MGVMVQTHRLFLIPLVIIESTKGRHDFFIEPTFKKIISILAKNVCYLWPKSI